MIGTFADRFNNRRWFIRYLLYTQWCILVTFAALLNALVLIDARRLQLLRPSRRAKWALTAFLGDPANPGAWRREVLPVCPRCCRALDTAGAEGVNEHPRRSSRHNAIANA